MTRLVKAWKSWAAATTILWIAARQTRFGSQRRDSEEARFSAIRSASRLIWAMSASVLVLACVPPTAFAGQRSNLHAHLGTTPIGNKSEHHSNGTTVQSRAARVDPPHCGRAQRTIHVNGELLAPGSGYGTPGGSCSVRALQRRLAAAGYVTGPFDGRYGPLTERAVRRYQGAYGLLVDGIAGPLTLGSLVARTPDINPGAGYAVNGSRPVRALQRRLARAGFHPGPVDGLYGPLTGQAVRRFQSAHGLSVDGVAGPRTLTRLSNDASSRPRPSHRAAHKPTRTAPAPHRTGHKRPTPATRTPAGVAKPQAQNRPSHGPGFGTILLICLGIAALVAVLLGVGRHMRSGRVTAPPEPPAGETPDASPAPVAVATSSPPSNVGKAQDGAETPDEADTPHDDRQSMNGVDLTPAVIASNGQDGPPREGGPPREHGSPREDGPPTDQDDLVGAFDRGGELAERGDFAGAEDAYRYAAQAGHGDAASNLGVLLEQRGDLESAEAAYRRADALGRAVGALNLGGLLAQRGDVAGAVAAYRRAAERGNASAAMNLGAMLADRGDIVGAEAAFRQAADGGSDGAVSRLGELLERRGDLGGAEAVYRRACELGDADAAFNLGRLLLDREETQGAEAAFRQAADSGDSDAASNLGVLLEQRGDDAGAESAYRQAVDQGHAVAAFNLGSLLQERGDLSGAEEAYLRAGSRGDVDVKEAVVQALQTLQNLREDPKWESPAR